jgi:hypothetical protein
MTSRRNRLQTAIDFLSLVASDGGTAFDNLPGQIDYAVLASMAEERDYPAAAEDIEEAFRIVMRARLASRR